MSISRQIEAVTSLQIEDAAKIPKYLEILNNVTFDEGHLPLLQEFIKSIIDIPFGNSIIRGIFTQLIGSLKGKNLPWNFEEKILLYLIECLAPLLMSFEEQDIETRLRLADIYELNDENMKASIALEQGINRRCLSDTDKFEWYIRIARNRLEIEDATSAEGFLNRAAVLRPKIKDISSSMIVHFKFSQARVSDSNRNFIDAARKYYDVSTILEVDPQEQMACLGSAATCIILAPAGPQRTQVLRLIYNDDRTRMLPDFHILEKLYTNRLLRHNELRTFEENLQPHQKVALPDGITVLSRSIIDHNLLAVSRIYSNISIDQLGTLLGLEKSKAEDYAGKMILQGRLAATIDQVDEIVQFISQDDKSSLLRWENKVKLLCSDLETLVSDITRRNEATV